MLTKKVTVLTVATILTTAAMSQNIAVAQAPIRTRANTTGGSSWMVIGQATYKTDKSPHINNFNKLRRGRDSYDTFGPIFIIISELPSRSITAILTLSSIYFH